jgi:methyl-accepting chemotaxis protein
MQSEKVLIMPNRSQERPSRLRSDENPPYPEFAIELLREVSKGVAEEISVLREDLSAMKDTIGALQTDLKENGEKLNAVPELKESLRTLENAARTQDRRMEEIEGRVHNTNVIVRVCATIGALAGLAVGALELYLHFYK